jgi:DNA-binding PadR family transcriptional regulator
MYIIEMGIKHALLGLLSKKPMHGYELKAEFDKTVGKLWSLNIGQVYATLNRLEKEGYITGKHIEQETRPNKRIFSITEEGRKEFLRWLLKPVEKPRRLKDDFYIKLTLLNAGRVVDVRALIWEQRKAYLRVLHELNEIKGSLDPATAPLLLLLVEGGILHTEADLKWLDVCEERLLGGEN